VVPSRTSAFFLAAAPKKPVIAPSRLGRQGAAAPLWWQSGRKGSVAPEACPARHFDFIARPLSCPRQL
jgi:hypothetical protein